MNEPVWIRELSGDEIPQATAAKTGDRLPDGSVLLWRDDMNRMGLDRLRRWLIEKVVDQHVTIAVGPDHASLGVSGRLNDEAR